ncbi:cysteine--tRNA ligase [Candidatus Kaiserbacteria bacterium CG10_big_fil_rev_8_21_14_0_10_59_10]|uniref:Cysteine--tRNA ligase n=1 Tax=Candidatus Kaiserbacteria bacterium CG10_big_fil_rev_8_21_14_0_10_59_10 TaxID=1974612 RepID=A0A2H0U753_9BACT|nr:MAG: cysteine--tRNA ligase [Candidatus Kaiserbacteria bacterium CG10_big_fil_rev_8_21_14_0_10_59_10]
MQWLQRLFGYRRAPHPPLYLHDTLRGEKVLFEPYEGKPVRMYNCGPTVYGRQHIGNLSMFVFTDVLRRTLEYNGFTVDQVINITDVGHLTSDEDEGEDKMTKGLQREGLPLSLENMRALGEKYTTLFLEDLQTLNIDTNRIRFPRASDHIPAQIAMIQALEEKGYAYVGTRGVYFDTTRFPEYGKLGGIDLAGLKAGARVKETGDKRNPIDFLLWKFDKTLGWPSPWGKGFPGWHIECSAMARSLLGSRIDIHTGGIEHIPVHHNNEIAQTEAATGKRPFSRFWLHRAHVSLEGVKIAKSEGNVLYLLDIVDRGYDPLALRYLFLQAHYRKPSNFSWEALGAAQQSLTRLRAAYAASVPPEDAKGSALPYERDFHLHVNNDLDTPGALAVVWGLVRDKAVAPSAKRSALQRFDSVLGLSLEEVAPAATITTDELPERVRTMLEEREAARKKKDWLRADMLRDKILNAGYTLEDTPSGPRLSKK